MRYFRSSNNPNALVAIFMLILLAIFAGPGMLPSLLSSIVPGADESIPCDWLRTGDDRAEHQSLLGRTVQNPLSIRVRPSAFPQQSGQTLDIVTIITNNSIGTVAIYFNHDPRFREQIGDDGQTSGFGLVFNSVASLPSGGNSGASYPETDIRLLGPRQSCVHHQTFTYEQVPQLGLNGAQNTVKAYYRNTSRGTSQPVGGTTQTIYQDQGMWVGIVESSAVAIPLSGS